MAATTFARRLSEQRICLLEIARVESLRERAVNRGRRLARSSVGVNYRFNWLGL